MFSRIAVLLHDHVDQFAFGHIAFSYKPTDLSRVLKIPRLLDLKFHCEEKNRNVVRDLSAKIFIKS